MARVKELNPQNPRKAIILYCMAMKGWNDGKLEKALGIGHTAKSSKMTNVDRFTLGEIIKIIHGVPLSPAQLDSLFGGISWEVSGLEMKLKGVF